MAKSNKTTVTFFDALFITNADTIRLDLQKVLDIERFNWKKANFNSFLETEFYPETIGTAIIDTESIPHEQHQQLLEVIQTLDKAKIPTVLYGESENIDLSKFSILNVINKQSFAQVVPVVKISNVYRKPKIQPLNIDITQKEYHAEQLEHQLKMAGLVQRDFLPRKLPNSNRLNWAISFMPADWVSGDIYDVARLDEHHIGFYLADAVGHSIPAALLTMFLKHAIQMRQTTGNEYKIFSPLEVITTLNKRMLEQNLSGCQFTTSCYFLLNTETLELSFCRAGHPYPILIQKNKQPQLLQSKGSLLGIFDSAQFQQETIQLSVGDKLLVYSDGAEPFINTTNDNTSFEFNNWFLGIAGLPADNLVAEFETVVRQGKNYLQPDDITLIALEIL
ncbi:MAG: serine/threonine-protein phosphatase [Planctomycetaceae bacterium]|nr:serine/threonine-protein phosphatase [Planctomycetaceae bacterium]